MLVVNVNIRDSRPGKHTLSQTAVSSSSLITCDLFREDHFLQQMVGTGKLVDCEQDVADVERNVAAIVRVEDNVTHRSFPDAVKVETDQIAVFIYDRAS